MRAFRPVAEAAGFGLIVAGVYFWEPLAAWFVGGAILLWYGNAR